VARPWVEIVSNNVLKNYEDLNNNNNENEKPHHGEESATFQRLGMKSSKVGNPDLEVSHLETRPLSPVHLKENIRLNQENFDEDDSKRMSMRKRLGSMKKILSPASAEVLARRDTVRSKNRMSRRTLQFLSPENEFSKLSEIAEPGIVDESRLSVPRQFRRSVQDRTENSRYSARRRSSKEQEFEGMTSQSENERSANRRKDSVIKSNRFIRRSNFSAQEPNREANDQANNRNMYVTSFDNPAYESVSDISQSRVNPQADRESVISPPRRRSVISPREQPQSAIKLSVITTTT